MYWHGSLRNTRRTVEKIVADRAKGILVKPVRTPVAILYLCAGKPPLADIILSHPPELTRCDSVIGFAIPVTSGHIQYRGAAS